MRNRQSGTDRLPELVVLVAEAADDVVHLGPERRDHRAELVRQLHDVLVLGDDTRQRLVRLDIARFSVAASLRLSLYAGHTVT